MNKQQALAKLKESLRDKFLGDLVIAATGQDLDIERIIPQEQQLLATDGSEYILKHSTVARIGGTIVGTANTYWRGAEKQWSIIRKQRMLQLLHSLDITFSDCRYTPVGGPMQRTISAPVGEGQLYIRERMFLNQLAQLLWTRNVVNAIKEGPK